MRAGAESRGVIAPGAVTLKVALKVRAPQDFTQVGGQKSKLFRAPGIKKVGFVL